MKEKDSAYYDSVYSRDNSPYLGMPEELEAYYPTWSRAASFICRFSERKGPVKIIDIGCGPGHFAKVLEEKGFFKRNSSNLYFGYDFSPKAVSMAKDLVLNANVNFYEKDVVSGTNTFSEAFEEGPKNIIYCSFEFLEHVEEDLLVLSKAKKGSKIFASVPSFDSAGHVRFFESSKEVIDRYSSSIRFNSVEEYPVGDSDEHKLYFMNGTII